MTPDPKSAGEQRMSLTNGHRILLVAVSMILVGSGLIWAWSSASEEVRASYRDAILLLIGVAALLGILLKLVSAYLAAPATDLTALERAQLNDEFSALRQELTQFRASYLGISEHDRATLARRVSEVIRDSVTPEFVHAIEEKYGSEIAKSSFDESARRTTEETRNRLLEEVSALTKRSNVNLMIGLGGSGTAIALLAYVVLVSGFALPESSLAFLDLAPKVSLAVLIELVAFFFLRLYKSGLEDIKYYQNELTDVESRYVAMRASLRPDLSENAQEILRTVAQVDRNSTIALSTAGKPTKDAPNAKKLEGLSKQVDSLSKSLKGLQDQLPTP